MKTAVFPGSFDPFTKGHEDVVRKALELFDKVVIAIGVNTTKQYMFDLSKRKDWINKVFADDHRVEVTSFEGLTVEYCKSMNASFILRGLRSPADFQYESNIAHMNKALAPHIETVFLVCDPSLAAINSSIVREIHKSGGPTDQFLPKAIKLNEA